MTHQPKQNDALKTADNMVDVVCQDCGREFRSYRMTLLGVDKPISHCCPVCREKKRREAEERERERLKAEIAQRKNGWRIESGIPMRFRISRFETFKPKTNNQKTILELCKDYADGFPLSKGASYKSLGLFSVGVWGLGKSHLACSIAHRVIDRWVGGTRSPVIYTTEPKMFARIRATFNKSYDSIAETEEMVYAHLINVPLLIVDDIGKEEVADPRFVQRVWFSLVNGRYDNMLPMVITANLDPDGIEQHLGGNRGNEATFDRLYEMLGGEFWELQGESYRRLKNGMPDKQA